MPVKPILPTKADVDALPEAMRGLYIERDGQFVIDLDGGVVPGSELAHANSRLAEFRDNNIKLQKQVAELTPLQQELTTIKKTYEGIDPAKAREAVEKLEKLEKKGVKGEDDLMKAIEAAILPIRTALEGQVTQLSTKLTEAEQKAQEQAQALTIKEFEGNVTAAAIRAGVDEKMLPHFVRHARETYKLENGQFVPKNGTTTIFSHKRPTEPMPLEEFIEAQQAEAPGFFKQNKGGNSSQSGAQGGPGMPPSNPNAKRLVNPTPEQLGQYAAAIRKGEVVVEHHRTA